MTKSKTFRFTETSANTKKDVEYLEKLEEYFKTSIGTNVEKIDNFSKYIPRQKMAYFLAKYEIFKKILYIQGSIIECGVLFGGGIEELPVQGASRHEPGTVTPGQQGVAAVVDRNGGILATEVRVARR